MTLPKNQSNLDAAIQLIHQSAEKDETLRPASQALIMREKAIISATNQDKVKRPHGPTLVRRP